MNTKWTTLTAALVLCTGAHAAFAQVRTPAAGDTPGRETRAPHAKHERASFARRHGIAHRLGLTAAQRTQLRAEVERVAPELRATRERARELVRGARQDGEVTPQEREQLRAQLRALRDEARGQVLPGARTLVASLTPEQRARLEAVAKAHGKTLDDVRLGERVAAQLVRKLARAQRAHALRTRGE